MTPEQALAFIGFAVVMAGTPGPSNTLLTALGAQVGVRRGLPALFGVAAGMALMMFTVSVGLGTLLVGSPLLLTAIRLAGAALLLWLAWKIATAPVRSPERVISPASVKSPEPGALSGRASSPTPCAPSADAPAQRARAHVSIAGSPRRVGSTAHVGFLGAAVFQWVNPKSWLASASAAAAFSTASGISPAEPFSSPAATSAPIHAATLAAIFAVTALPCCLPWLAFGAVLQRVLHSPRAQRTFNLSMAALLCLSVAVLFAT